MNTYFNQKGQEVHGPGPTGRGRRWSRRGEYPQTARSLNNLARLLHARDELAAARPLYERSLAIQERVLGPTTLTPPSLGNIWMFTRWPE